MSMAASSAILCAGAVLQVFSTKMSMLLASRWLLRFGIPFSLVNNSALVAELAQPDDCVGAGVIFPIHIVRCRLRIIFPLHNLDIAAG